MNRFEIEKKLPDARIAVESILINSVPKEKVGEYRNKMSSFSSMVLMNGLISTLAYYFQNDPKVVELIAKNKGLDPRTYFNELIDLKEKKNEVELKVRTDEALVFATSLKLVLNLYK